MRDLLPLSLSLSLSLSLPCFLWHLRADISLNQQKQKKKSPANKEQVGSSLKTLFFCCCFFFKRESAREREIRHRDSTAFPKTGLFFAARPNAEVILRLIQQQPRTGEHQQREGKEERERCLLSPLRNSASFRFVSASLVKRLLWRGAHRSCLGFLFLEGGVTPGIELHHTDKNTTYAWISALFPFANAKGNMQRSLTILYTSLLGMCLGSSSSFPSNINIGENGAHASDLYVSYLYFKFCLMSLFSARCVVFSPRPLCPTLTPRSLLLNRRIVPHRIARIWGLSFRPLSPPGHPQTGAAGGYGQDGE